MIELANIRAFDSETPRFRPGEMAPRIICASVAEIVDNAPRGELIADQEAALDRLEAFLDGRHIYITFANAAYDLAVAAQARPRLLAKIFAALREGRIHDIIVSQALDAIYHGHLGYMPSGQELRKPSTGEVTNRYSLEICSLINLNKVDAKQNDVWRESYALLEGIPVERWPYEAKQYPVDDSVNTAANTVVQLHGREGRHAWVEIPGIPQSAVEPFFTDASGWAVPPITRCKHCSEELTFAPSTPVCHKAPREPHKNLENLPAQLEADFSLKLGAAHSLRVDPVRVEKLAAEVDKKHKVAVERFQKKGWIRDDGTEDQSAVKRAVARAYGAKGLCPRCKGGASCKKCGGSGKVLASIKSLNGICTNCDGVGTLIGKVVKIETVECRGEKVRGRYQGCAGDGCQVCSGKRELQRYAGEITCKNIYDENEAMVEAGCDGTGFDLSTAPMLPRTDKMGVGTDRDTKMESGDEDMSDYGEDEFEKSRSTYVPYLRTGVTGPLYISSNVIVATGRCSYEGCPLHQMPRTGGERQCVRARGAWCGCPVEYILGSTDYEAGELCTLSSLCYWLFDYSQMRDAINASGKPGILHSDLAAEVLGIPLDEFLKRLKAKDKQAVDFRQMCKPINFGVPGGMGVAKLVLTSRKKNAGFTVAADGPARNAKGEPGYWGVRFCLLTGGARRCGEEKVTEWKNYPCAPVCRACLRVVDEMLKPAYHRRYPEIRDYHKWVQKMIERKKPAPCVVWSEEEGAAKIIRERGTAEFSAFANNGFQAMLADIGKHAFVEATRECYLGVKPDGSPSPLAGCRLPLYLHDEPLSELIRSTAHKSGPRIAEIMMESGRKFAPHVVWKAETALAYFWDKNMEPTYVEENGEQKLVPWGPVPEEEMRLAA